MESTSDPAFSPENAPFHTRKMPGQRGPRRTLRPFGIVAGFAFFGLAIYFSGRLGIQMAKQRTAETAPVPEPAPSNSVRLGSTGDPVYLAQSPDNLRRFFSAHPTAFERARADLSGLRIRRLQDSMEIIPVQIEADAVEVRITSGALSGATYWIHHSQLPASARVDPIVAPVPGFVPEP